MITTDTPKIYVASLSDYNAGRLHGRWIDLVHVTVDDVAAEINAMLAKSSEPFAEEWAIHDYEGFGGLRLSEYEDLDRVVTIAQWMTNHGAGPIAAFVANDPSRDLSDFDDAYCGQWESMAAYAEEYVSDNGWPFSGSLTGDDLEPVWSFIDWDHVGNEMDLSDWWSADAPDGGVYVFRRY